MELPLLGLDTDCFPSSKVCLVCWPLTRAIFCILLFNWDSHEPLSKVSAKHPSPIKQPKSSNQLPRSAPAEPPLLGLHFLLLHCKCGPACGDFTNINLLCRCRLTLNPIGAVHTNRNTNESVAPLLVTSLTTA